MASTGRHSLFSFVCFLLLLTAVIASSSAEEASYTPYQRPALAKRQSPQVQVSVSAPRAGRRASSSFHRIQRANFTMAG